MSEGLSPHERAERLARYYDLDFLDIAYDAELYQQLAQAAAGPVLELGVGSGRLAVPLALAGHEVLGVDNDEAMLSRALTTWERVRGDIEPERFAVVHSDFNSFRGDRRFALALIAVNTFLLAPDDDARLAILETMRSHLERGGIAAVEIGTPTKLELQRYDRRIQHEWLRTDPDTGEAVSKSISANYDVSDETLELTQIYEWTPPFGGSLRRAIQIDLLHLLPAQRLGELASKAGFGDIRLWGDHLTSPYGAGSHRAILEARLV